ncbi:hypothetical protein LTR10_006262 [Elasticomyces elasticus]|nr:hypothetical protein LTR10_006262 [Elasticomyces elasticus]KAK4966688.1 hypothetical protein LTR42_010999 [Elasticomyces elasticus]
MEPHQPESGAESEVLPFLTTPPVVPAVKRGGPLRLYPSILPQRNNPPQSNTALEVPGLGPWVQFSTSWYGIHLPGALVRAKDSTVMGWWLLLIARRVCGSRMDLTLPVHWNIEYYYGIANGIDFMTSYERRDDKEFGHMVGYLACQLKSSKDGGEDEESAELRIMFVRAVVEEVDREFKIWRRLWPEAGKKHAVGKLD